MLKIKYKKEKRIAYSYGEASYAQRLVREAHKEMKLKSLAQSHK